MTPVTRSRRTLVAIGMVGSPICLSVGNLLLPSTSGTPAQAAAAVHTAAYLPASVIDAAGFALLGAVGVGIAMLVQRRGSALATLGAVLAVIGGVVMGGAVLTSAFVQAALPAADAAQVIAALQTDGGLGSLFLFSIVAGLGGLLAAVAVLIGRPVPVWIGVMLIASILIANFGGGVLGAVLAIPFLAVDVLLARALIRADPADAAVRPGVEAAVVA